MAGISDGQVLFYAERAPRVALVAWGLAVVTVAPLLLVMPSLFAAGALIAAGSSWIGHRRFRFEITRDAVRVRNNSLAPLRVLPLHSIRDVEVSGLDGRRASPCRQPPAVGHLVLRLDREEIVVAVIKDPAEAASALRGIQAWTRMEVRGPILDDSGPDGPVSPDPVDGETAVDP